MTWLPPALLAAPVIALLALGLVPSRKANEAARLVGRLTTFLAGFSLLVSIAAAVRVVTLGPMDAVFLQWTAPVPIAVGFHVDAVAVVMMTLISFIGLVIARYSATYLQGDERQGRFFRWMSVTLGGTLLFVMSGNLVMLTAAWMLTSYGLHQLLTHYPDRTWAIWAARKKFLISRLGDAMLIAAVVLTFRTFGTTDYVAVFAAADAIHAGEGPGEWSMTIISLLFVLGAMTKSAQFPFHSWLPDTMETPTPVSALMHAGVINAGGFLVIRLGPLVSLSPIALDLLALMGGMTALLGSVVMLTQTSVKRSLAYSTIAQMGFMMLQCGMGAFSAALLHIVAHSAYKAHAFLSCGSVLDSAAGMKVSSPPATSRRRSLMAFAGALSIAAGIVVGTFELFGISLIQKPGGAMLGLVMTLALTQLLWNGMASGVLWVAVRSISLALLVMVAYTISLIGVERLVASSTSHHVLVPSILDVAVLVIVALGFVAVFALQALSGPLSNRRWFRALYVHAMNGFYIDIPARRLTAWCYRQAGPVQ
ncbi:MAG: proton-conducting transporter membrane subunit [Planctomycetaceae bacterium]